MTPPRFARTTIRTWLAVVAGAALVFGLARTSDLAIRIGLFALSFGVLWVLVLFPIWAPRAVGRLTPGAGGVVTVVLAAGVVSLASVFKAGSSRLWPEALGILTLGAVWVVFPAALGVRSSWHRREASRRARNDPDVWRFP